MTWTFAPCRSLLGAVLLISLAPACEHEKGDRIASPIAASSPLTVPDADLAVHPANLVVLPREYRRALAPEPTSVQAFEFGIHPLLVDTTAGPLMSLHGRWIPGAGSGVPFTRSFMQIDEQTLWIQPKVGAALLRIPRDRDLRYVRGDFECPGWLFGERDDLLWCAEERDEYVDIRVIDKSGFGAPSLVTTLPQLYQSSLHASLEHQGPVIVGERVMMAANSGFVSTELEGDAALEFLELGHRPNCVVACGERLAWRDARGRELYSGELPLSTIRREYVGDDLRGCPAWAGDSLLITLHEGETMKLVRLTEDGAQLSLAQIPQAPSKLVSDGERAWWFVPGDGLWWIDASSHGKVDTVEFFPYTMTADEGSLSWLTDGQGGPTIYISDMIQGGVIWL